MAKVSQDYLKRQAEVLQQHHGDRDRTQVAADINVSTDQLKRYLLGTTMLRPDLVVPIARAYGIDSNDLARELGIVAPAEPEQTLAQMLEAIGMPDDERRQLLSSIGNDPTTREERDAIVRFVAGVLRKRAANRGQQRRRA